MASGLRAMEPTIASNLLSNGLQTYYSDGVQWPPTYERWPLAMASTSDGLHNRISLCVRPGKTAVWPLTCLEDLSATLAWSSVMRA